MEITRYYVVAIVYKIYIWGFLIIVDSKWSSLWLLVLWLLLEPAFTVKWCSYLFFKFFNSNDFSFVKNHISSFSIQFQLFWNTIKIMTFFMIIYNTHFYISYQFSITYIDQGFGVFVWTVGNQSIWQVLLGNIDL